ncbi:MAG TPA: hypothetical protein V6D47_01565 [Oscillatoriaceae cyanobacterium]
MSVSSVSPGSTNPYVNGANRRQQFLQQLQGDNSQQAQTVKSDFAKIAADLQSGDSNALKSDSQSLHTALQAYRQASGGGQVHRGHGHHHHHDQDQDQDALSATSSTPDPSALTAQNPLTGSSATDGSQDPLEALMAQLQSQQSNQSGTSYDASGISIAQFISIQA